MSENSATNPLDLGWAGRTFGRIPAPALFLGSGCIQYYGAALATTLFLLMPPVTVAWLRMLSGALVMMLWRRPWRLKLNWREVAASGLFGLVLIWMNMFFYESISRLPLGTVVSLEFLGPVMVAVFSGRGMLIRWAALLALVGVASIGGLGVDWQDPATGPGILLALGAAASWAGYIVLGRRIAMKRNAIDNLAVGGTISAAVMAPFCMWWAAPVLASWYTAFIAIAVGVLSTVIPYTLEAICLGKLEAHIFSLLTSLLPLTSALVGAVVLAQIPSGGEIFGMICVSGAVAIANKAKI